MACRPTLKEIRTAFLQNRGRIMGLKLGETLRVAMYRPLSAYAPQDMVAMDEVMTFDTVEFKREEFHTAFGDRIDHFFAKIDGEWLTIHARTVERPDQPRSRYR